MKFRVYADGRVLNEDEFNEADNSLPYYDDYAEYEVPEEIIDEIISYNEVG
jgi:hypothetical protein